MALNEQSPVTNGIFAILKRLASLAVTSIEYIVTVVGTANLDTGLDRRGWYYS